MASPPSTSRAWQFSSAKGGLDKNLHINDSAAVPKPGPQQHLVQIIACAVNPIDYKLVELPFIGGFLGGKNATPCRDFAGRIVTPAAGSPLKAGQLVFGLAGASPIAGGAMAQYALATDTAVTSIPQGLDPVDAATVGIAGLTGYQTIAPYVKQGDKVFLNGGSGGVGVFAIQFAKSFGCHVTTSCSTANVDLCKKLGADDVVDYKKGDVVDALVASGKKFDHVVDNVGYPSTLYYRAHEFTTPEAKFVVVGGEFSYNAITTTFGRLFRPGFLGGGKRKLISYMMKPTVEDLNSIGKLMSEGKVKAIVDTKFLFEEGAKAFEKIKTGRAKGKIVVVVDEKAGQ
ncbi:NAD(P)-binding Rossmann-fold containing protein [Glarea lozoyensis ATCC 20868]|uniref:NAD(P)-binding Rossmann-fold containing protein n=2 Tax=Glarea lozoyensis TaxID=101852 RepID=S3DBV1_GLAL2|nr:NAD(P)-binding Rossmann-fold containing protein [Glarea lozoyensis ATCC 20868]EHK97494.1 putative Zinc-type alcohol dehydrogenase-like protein C16A3.02c [Glarea lozoyensis 74030]EPE24138.1 NAD(P)-binding Rossmann-fold containing protein [Glarea lozoyensis ATCC 20868]